ncbi:hypothetical protein PLICRDRAFT_180213 [Plicaturopsis crispa FD-325 SS-3]|uniref:Uncharacterized protein n=1 Tax=Plicaturopsis crispa FD-325 SS-3 TaxID=944288 RepID=A0A0C9SKE6_PLICR|nr:hypothetical protein PLICRDRAFT_180213 [Plicaturopsis crispa FD-325 SS-3]
MNATPSDQPSPVLESPPLLAPVSPPSPSQAPKSLPTAGTGGHIIPPKVTESTVYKVVTGLLGTAKEVLDDVSVPGLKAVLSGVLLVINSIEQADKNYDDFNKLAKRVSDMDFILLKDTQRTLPPALHPCAQVFVKEMAQIAEQVKTKIEESRQRRFYNQNSDKGTVTDQAERINKAVSTFMLAAVIRNHIKIDSLANIGWFPVMIPSM